MPFPEAIRYVAIEGVIGAGKTSLVKHLSQRLACVGLFEEFENNPFLSDFYSNRNRYAFQTQLFFLLSRHRQIQENFSQQDLFRPQIIADYMFAKDKIFASINLDENELGLYMRLCEVLENQLVRPDFVVYLQTDTQVLLKRIRQRDRFFEREIDSEYIKTLNQSYNTFFHHYQDSPLLIINTNDIDFVKNAADMDMLVDEILHFRPGVTFFSPIRPNEV